jgi:pyruvate/2-oxoglutarate dehydrogenase complex dihydrolipoamide acyltransferase (E2) component
MTPERRLEVLRGLNIGCVFDGDANGCCVHCGNWSNVHDPAAAERREALSDAIEALEREQALAPAAEVARCVDPVTNFDAPQVQRVPCGHILPCPLHTPPAPRPSTEAMEAKWLQAVMNAKKAEREHAADLACITESRDNMRISADSWQEAASRGQREHAAALAAKDKTIAALEAQLARFGEAEEAQNAATDAMHDAYGPRGE